MTIKRSKRKLLLVGYKYIPEIQERIKRMVFPLINAFYSHAARAINRPAGIVNLLIRKIPVSFTRNLPFAEQARSFLYAVGITRRGARCYVKKHNYEEFTRALNERGIQYVVLRWWDRFPVIPAGEDLDMLMEEDEFLRIKDLITYRKTPYKCDVYLLNGISPGHWNHLPYFPNTLFKEAIQHRVLHNQCVYVPDKERYFATLAYHAVFHKGLASGIPGFKVSSYDQDDTTPEHDYPKILRDLSAAYGLDVDIDVRSIVSWLEQKGYAPNTDTLAKLIDLRPELSFLHNRQEYDYTRPELAVFVIREQAVRDNLTDTFVNVFKKMRFDILGIAHLSDEEKKRAAKSLRGGKWDKAHYSMSGGDPQILITTLDYHPCPAEQKKGSPYNWFDNKNVLRAKRKCRKALAQTRLFRDYNPIHCADNESEAIEYLEVAIPDQKQQILEHATQRRQRYYTRFPVIETLSKGRRSKVELIDYKGERAIKKTFRIGCDAFFEREMFVLEQMTEKWGFVPTLYERGSGYYIVKYYENILCFDNTPVLKKQLKPLRSNIIGIIRAFYDEGYSYINFTPENLLLTQAGELKAIDFEFVQRYPQQPDRLSKAWEVQGVPKGYTGDLPSGFDHRNSSFRMVWSDYIGAWSEES